MPTRKLEGMAYKLGVFDRGEKIRRAVGDISVADIMSVLERWFVRRGSRDINALMSRLANMTWRTAPDSDELMPMADLYEDFCEHCPVAILPNKKLVLVLICIKRHMYPVLNYDTLYNSHYTF